MLTIDLTFLNYRPIDYNIYWEKRMVLLNLVNRLEKSTAGEKKEEQNRTLWEISHFLGLGWRGGAGGGDHLGLQMVLDTYEEIIKCSLNELAEIGRIKPLLCLPF